jgi:subtilisin family serine protease
MDQSTSLQRLNPELGWFFYDRHVEVTAEVVQRRFADSFLDHLGRRNTAGVLQSGERTPAPDDVIVFSSYNAVYIPASFFSNPDDPSADFRSFLQSEAGSEFSDWTFERDMEVYATGLQTTVEDYKRAEQSGSDESATDQILMAAQGISATAIPIRVYWHLLQVLAEPLWPYGKGQGSTVAVLDTGLDPNNGLLTAGSLGGASFVPGNPSYNDDQGHGTHVTGILAARPGTHSSGRPLYWSIAPGASHYSVKVLDQSGFGTTSQLIQGLDWARNTGVDVINMSLGVSREPPILLANAVALASQRAVIVAAAGNDGPGNDTVNWPARYRQVIGVGAVDRNRVIAGFSSRGPADPNAFVEDNVECVAPGVDISSNRLGGGAQDLITESGTSMAAPIVSAICALLKQKDSSLTGTNGFRFRLRRSFIDLGIGGPDNWYGIGLVHFNPSS